MHFFPHLHASSQSHSSLTVINLTPLLVPILVAPALINASQVLISLIPPDAFISSTSFLCLLTGDSADKKIDFQLQNILIENLLKLTGLQARVTITEDGNIETGLYKVEDGAPVVIE